MISGGVQRLIHVGRGSGPSDRRCIERAATMMPRGPPNRGTADEGQRSGLTARNRSIWTVDRRDQRSRMPLGIDHTEPKP
ncbi:hypothetical protein MA16_Dca019190 [Dendrobium catenatum]|uniref:Uncharacterized protein n=1 Tax=Dendrobium catenatum TaxID=906689 RepID=A0A2I0VYC0_9ASPA|nr:hypothetical protein MA16_Dca019190 [Dendrobium catenatum]